MSDNHKIADLVLIQIKALYASTLAKIQLAPDVTNSQKDLSLVTRDVLIPTVGMAGEGDVFQHPQKIEFNNTIQAIHHNGGLNFKFETIDGKVSEHPGCTYAFKKAEITPKETQITKIQVWYYTDYISGFKLFSNDAVVLEAGGFSNEMKEVTLEVGERLLGIKSKIYDKAPHVNSAAHCNLSLVIGKLA